LIFLPAIDIIDGLCVRLTEGDYSRRSDYGLSPADAALDFEKQGAQWIHIVDLDGAKAGHPINLEAILKVRETVSVRIEVGGGIRTLEDAASLLNLGVDRVIVGTSIVRNLRLAESLFSTFGDSIAAGLDLRDGRPATHAWTSTEDKDGLELAQELQAMGCHRFIVTDIATDGAFTGPNTSLMAKFARSLSARVVASGGVSSLDDLIALAPTGVEGVICGKAIYEGRLSVEQAVNLLRTTSYQPAGPP
jgi:phosphoribosylformimino-5-aminoimidazole carboxamide ribotide isomerase